MTAAPLLQTETSKQAIQNPAGVAKKTLQNPPQTGSALRSDTFHIDENIDTIIKRFLNSLCSKEDLFKVLKHIQYNQFKAYMSYYAVAFPYDVDIRKLFRIIYVIYPEIIYDCPKDVIFYQMQPFDYCKWCNTNFIEATTIQNILFLKTNFCKHTKKQTKNSSQEIRDIVNDIRPKYIPNFIHVKDIIKTPKIILLYYQQNKDVFSHFIQQMQEIALQQLKREIKIVIDPPTGKPDIDTKMYIQGWVFHIIEQNCREDTFFIERLYYLGCHEISHLIQKKKGLLNNLLVFPDVNYQLHDHAFNKICNCLCVFYGVHFEYYFKYWHKLSKVRGFEPVFNPALNPGATLAVPALNPAIPAVNGAQKAKETTKPKPKKPKSKPHH